MTNVFISDFATLKDMSLPYGTKIVDANGKAWKYLPVGGWFPVGGGFPVLGPRFPVRIAKAGGDQ